MTNMVWCKGVHEYAATYMNATIFDHFFSPFFYLAMPWNLKWIFFTLYCLQIPYKNHYIVFNLYIIDSSRDVLVCRFTWFITTTHSKHLWSCMIQDKNELQRIEWIQHKNFVSAKKYTKNKFKNIIFYSIITTPNLNCCFSPSNKMARN